MSLIEQLQGVIHELAHLLVEEVTFNCFGGLPTWLDEGLAVYAEGSLPGFSRARSGAGHRRGRVS